MALKMLLMSPSLSGHVSTDSWISQASAPDWVTSPQGQGSNPAMAGHPYGQRGFHNLGSDYYHLFDAVDEDANSIENFQTTR